MDEFILGLIFMGIMAVGLANWGMKALKIDIKNPSSKGSGGMGTFGKIVFAIGAIVLAVGAFFLFVDADAYQFVLGLLVILGGLFICVIGLAFWLAGRYKIDRSNRTSPPQA